MFQSTPPMQGATNLDFNIFYGDSVSIHAPYAGSDDAYLKILGALVDVSIHAPYAGSDISRLLWTTGMLRFNPRPLCRERR